MKKKIPFSDYRELLSIVNNGGGYYELFQNQNWHEKYFDNWRHSTFNVSPSIIIKQFGLKGFIKTVLQKYKG